MSSHFRLVIAGLVAALATALGFMNTGVERLQTDARQTRQIESAWMPSVSSVDEAAARVLESGLFPRARLWSETDAASETLTVNDIERAFEDPSLAALVQFGEVWSVFLFADTNQSLRLSEGDEVSGGWYVSSIGAAHVEFSRGSEARRINVFEDSDG